jgi:lysophospholipase L1-like esterase
MAGRIQLRRGSAANLAAANPILAIGEPAIETDTGKLKIGNGVDNYNTRPYIDAAGFDHIADTVGAHNASAIAFTPAGSISASTVQAAIAELDSEAPTRFAPLAGARVVPIGDSTVIANSDAKTWGSRDIFGWAHVLSGGAWRYVANAGVGGDTSTMALARFDTAVTPNSPDVVPIVLGINDAVGGTSLATYSTNIKAFVAKCRTIGALPVIFTVAPNLNTGTAQQLIADYNDWLRSYASVEGIPLVDTNSLLTDPANGDYLSAYRLDGTHQNEGGAKVMAAAFNTAIAKWIQPWSPPMAVSNTADANNIVTNGLFLTNTAGLGTGWVNTAGTCSIVSGSSPVKGNWQRLTDNGVATANIRQNMVLGTVEVGDVLEFSGRVRSVFGTSVATWSLFMNCVGSTGGVSYIANAWAQDVDGAFTTRAVVGAGTTSLQVQLARVCTTGGNGYTEISQITVRNLTKRLVIAAG